MVVVVRKPLASPFLLSILFLVLPSVVASSSPRTAIPRPGSPRSHVLDYQQDDDYENVSDDAVSSRPPTPNPSVPRCKYNPCQDQQEPCLLMAAAQGCSCPGTSGPQEPPEPPMLFRLWREGGGGVLVHWCAPASTVTTYHVRVEGQSVLREVGERTRLLDLGEVAAGAKVCVDAVNNAGVSEPADPACTRFEPNSSETSLVLKLGVIGGVVLVVLLALALLLWKVRTYRNRRAQAETCGGGGEIL